ncbi:MAG: threonine/serine dehydratase [Anaerolineae bacterium]
MLLQRPPTARELLQARAAVRSHVMHTPLRPAAGLSARYGCEVMLKLENWQPTGSFKVRGAVNLLSQLSGADRARGLVTASAGNHALAVGYAAQRLGITGVTVFVPRTAPRAKVDKLRRFPVAVEEVGETYDDAHHAAEEYERARGATFIHAYDDARTVAGAGTVGFEVVEDWPEVDVVFVPVGGGGLIAGTALAVKALAPHVRVYGVQPEASPALRDSLRQGRALEEYPAGPTICDGLAGGIGQIVFQVAPGHIDDVLVVPEAAVRRAVAALVREEQMVVEGSGAVGLAALENLPAELTGKRVALVISGGNIDAGRLTEILEENRS